MAITEALILDDGVCYTLVELVRHSGLGENELIALVEAGALETLDARAGHWSFAGGAVSVARTARSLRDAFDLTDAHSVAVVTRFALRVALLERELAAVRARSGER